MTVDRIVESIPDKLLRLDQKVATPILAMCEKAQSKDASTRDLIVRLKHHTDMAQQNQRLIGGREMMFYIVRFMA
eukprot:12023332-Prorocentrum_lima.AAC.1